MSRRVSEDVKLAAGSLVAYPSTALHRRRGSDARRAARRGRLGAQPCARRAQRELLFELDTARRQLFKREGKSAEYDLVSKSLANLMRMWVED